VNLIVSQRGELRGNALARKNKQLASSAVHVFCRVRFEVETCITQQDLTLRFLMKQRHGASMQVVCKLLKDDFISRHEIMSGLV